jgi:hypothetical protein
MSSIIVFVIAFGLGCITGMVVHFYRTIDGRMIRWRIARDRRPNAMRARIEAQRAIGRNG